MFYVSRNSREKLVHNQQCPHAKRILPKNRIYYSDVRIAVADGYRMCQCCSPIYKRFRAEQNNIEKFCRGKNISYTIGYDVMKIKTPDGEWLLWCHPVSYSLQLFHRNKFRTVETADHASSMFPGYHLQQTFHSSVVAYLNYIYHHDLFRKSHPAVQTELPKRKKGKHRKRNSSRKELVSFKKSKGGKYKRSNKSDWMEQEVQDWGDLLAAEY